MLKLKKFTKEDIAPLISLVLNEREMWQFAATTFTWPLTQEQLLRYLHSTDKMIYKVVDEAGNTVGHADIVFQNDGTVRLCRILIGGQHRGKGYGKALISELLRIAAEELKATGAELNVATWNVPAIACYESCGFRVDPKDAKQIVINGETWPLLNMKLTF